MTPGPVLLDADLLARFEAVLRAKGVPAVDNLMPGLTDAEIDEIIEPVGLELPEEVRAWWRWHNGGRRYTPLLPSRGILSLEEAIAEYAGRVRPELGFFGEPEYALRPLGEMPAIFVQCVGSGDIPAPIYTLQDWTDATQLVLPSFGELVLTWIDYLKRDVYAIDPEDRRFGYRDEQHYPPDILKVGVR